MKRKEAKSPEYKAWRKAVYKRDKHKCVCCDKKGYLNAHHLDAWSWAIELRYEVSNGVTLCWRCHRDFHREFGRRNNNRGQFSLFISRFGKTLGDIL